MDNGKSMLIYASAPVEKTTFVPATWSPLAEKTGIPGTEEAVIHISRELDSSYPITITVVNLCGDEAGRYGGVQWIDARNFDPAQAPEFDVAFFLSHDAAIDCVRRGLKAERLYLWMENQPPEAEVLPYMGNVFHKIMPLTSWSRSCYPNIPDHQIFRTRNGVNLKDIDRYLDTPRQRHRLVYGSDYDRGLSILLKNWPHIKQQFPAAELDVFYGWNIFDSKTERVADPTQRAQRLEYKAMINQLFEQPGVHHHGRVSHQDVARLFCQADVWAYPCLFPESSCITAMKAQIAGAIPVVIPTGALKDTVIFGYKTTQDGDNWVTLSAQAKQQCMQEWFAYLFKAMADDASSAEMRTTMQAQTRDYFSWKTIAAEWAQEILSTQQTPSMVIF